MSATTFQSLSPDIVATVVGHAENTDELKNLRLVSKDFDTYASRHLFARVFLNTEYGAIQNWNTVAQNDKLANLAQHATLWTQDDVNQHINDPCSSEDGADEDAEEDYAAAVSALGRFRNLKSVEICFTPWCKGSADPDDWLDVIEEFDDRQRKLKLIFKTLHARAQTGRAKPIRKLTIVNLQNDPSGNLTSGEMFRNVMGQLDELNLELIQEYNEAGPDHDYQKIELRTFPPHLINDWLSPIAGNLKVLSLYSKTDNWGHLFPGVYDFSALSFPKLERLALGYYTIAHDDQLDWLLATKSLKTLVLHRCMILSHMCIYSLDEWDVDIHDWEPEEGFAHAFSYYGKWSSIFNKLATDLPLLQEFSFEYPDYDEQYRQQYGVRNRHFRNNVIFPQRYVHFDEGTLPTHWPEANRQGVHEGHNDFDYPNDHLDNLEVDQKALDHLLSVCRSRARKRQ